MPAFAHFGTNEWVILFLVLLLGWLLGLVSRSGGAKWRRAYEAERDARIEEQRERDAALATANTRIAELEAAARPVPVAAAHAPVVAPVATAETLDLRRDDLSAIRGIGRGGERRLNAQGLYRYADIVGLSRADEEALEQKLGADPGYIEQERWREQAALLDAGRTDEHRATFG
jgi:predicted flap endonuclease-1-like 5' DNA nuclease